VAANTIVSVSPSSPSVKQGEEFDIIVSISTTPEDMTSGSQFTLLFDPRLIEIIGFTEGNFYKDWAVANGAETILAPEPIADNEAGVVPTIAISLIGYIPDEIKDRVSGSGTLMVMRAKAKDREGTAELKLDDVAVNDFPVGVSRTDIKNYEGVKIQNGVVAVGGEAVQNTPEAVLVPTATRPPVLVERPTVEVVTPAAAASQSDGDSGSGFGGSWLIAIPIIGAVLLAFVVFTVRKR
jgi:hypothetical protein